MKLLACLLIIIPLMYGANVSERFILGPLNTDFLIGIVEGIAQICSYQIATYPATAMDINANCTTQVCPEELHKLNPQVPAELLCDSICKQVELKLAQQS